MARKPVQFREGEHFYEAELRREGGADGGPILTFSRGLPDDAARLLVPDRPLRRPDDPNLQPHRHFLQWHRENVFNGWRPVPLLHDLQPVQPIWSPAMRRQPLPPMPGRALRQKTAASTSSRVVSAPVFGSHSRIVLSPEPEASRPSGSTASVLT